MIQTPILARRTVPGEIELRIPQTLYLSTRPPVDFHGELRIRLTDAEVHELQLQLDVASNASSVSVSV